MVPGEIVMALEQWRHKKRDYVVSVLRYGSTVTVRNEGGVEFEYTPHEFSSSFVRVTKTVPTLKRKKGVTDKRIAAETGSMVRVLVEELLKEARCKGRLDALEEAARICEQECVRVEMVVPDQIINDVLNGIAETIRSVKYKPYKPRVKK